MLGLWDANGVRVLTVCVCVCVLTVCVFAAPEVLGCGCLQRNVALSLFVCYVSIINHTIANPVSI